MPELPGGTLTFLLTDIEGSTRLWERESAAMRHALVRHDALFEEVVDRHDGVVVRPRGEGDSRFAVFPLASDAVAAAAECQQALFNESWPTSTPLRVRMALHTGEAALRDGDYYGSAVNRCARLRSLAHGGQTLLSRATAQLVRESLPEGVTMRDLGEHVLKDLTLTEHVFQLVIPGLPAEFPPLSSTGHHPTNLPGQTTTFVGREHEIDAVRQRLLDPTVRLVTLIGPGGAGKTRLALQVAHSILDEFEDGVFFVSLANVHEPDLLIPTIAKVLGVRETSGEFVVDTLKEYLRSKQLLLVLDNLDHLLDAAPGLADLLADCPQLKILATSRETLHVRASRDFVVPPLGLPDLNRLPPLDRLAEYEAVRLFVERAQDAKADFELTVENAAIVAEICHRLDGLPLAIELAAARIRLFPPKALLNRLNRRLPLLTGGPRDLPERQQTLRATIEWSYDLLDAHEKAIYRRVSVFAGGFDFEAAEAVIQLSGPTGDRGAKDEISGSGMERRGEDPLELDVLSGLDSLVAKSLLFLTDSPTSMGEPRFRMLQTIREYGLERLEEHHESEVVRRQHATFYLELAETAEPELTGPEQGVWLARLELDHDNLRAAIEWAIERKEVDIGLRLTGALWPFWDVRGYFAEGRRWLERVLALGGEPEWRAKALTGAGTMAWSQGDYAEAAAFHAEALALYQGLGDDRGAAFALNNLGAQVQAQGDHERATSLYHESLSLYREQNDELGIAGVLNNLGVIASYEGDYDRAMKLYEESLTLYRRHGDHQRVADALYNLAEIANYQHDYDRAVKLYEESLMVRRSLGARWGAASGLAALASIAIVKNRLERAARLGGAAEVMFEATGVSLDASDRALFARIVETLRDELGDEAYGRAWMEGRNLSEDEAIEYALAGAELPDVASSTVAGAQSRECNAAA